MIGLPPRESVDGVTSSLSNKTNPCVVSFDSTENLPRLHMNFGTSSFRLEISGIGGLLVAGRSINDESSWVDGSSIGGC